MPTYAYRCKSCGHRFERHQTFTDHALKVCPRCHKWTLQRVIPLVRIAFKGSGSYSTDNKAGASPGNRRRSGRTRRNLTRMDAAVTTPKKPADDADASKKPD